MSAEARQWRASVAPYVPDSRHAWLDTPDWPISVIADRVSEYLSRHICFASERELHVCVLWALHTHLAARMLVPSSPRLLIRSSMPGAGKSTLLEHLKELTHSATSVGVAPSISAIARITDETHGTLLLDEFDKLDMKDNNTKGVMAIVNHGFSRRAEHVIQVEEKKKWVAKKFRVFAPVAFAALPTVIPDDTISRTIEIMMVASESVEPTYWDRLAEPYARMRAMLSNWADGVEADGRLAGLEFDLGSVPGRTRDKYLPLYQTAWLVGGEWTDRFQALFCEDMEAMRDGVADLLMTPNARLLLTVAHHYELHPWPNGRISSEDLVAALVEANGVEYGGASEWALTPPYLGQRLGRAYGIRTKTVREGQATPKRYVWSRFAPHVADMQRRYGDDWRQKAGVA